MRLTRPEVAEWSRALATIRLAKPVVIVAAILSEGNVDEDTMVVNVPCADAMAVTLI